MKTRISALALALVLLLTAIAFPANAAEKSIFQVLLDFIEKNGEVHYAYDNYVSNYLYTVKTVVCDKSSSTGTVELNMQYFPHFWNVIYFHITPENDQSGYTFSMALNPDGTFGACELSGEGGIASYSSVTAITNTSLLQASEYMEGEGRHEQMDKMASTLLKYGVEMLQVILKQEGRSIADLGFTAYVPGHRHSWDNGKITLQPSCAYYGEKEFTCAACNGIFLDYIQPTGKHTWRRDQIITEPTCTQPGVASYLCSVCEQSKEASIPALGHAWTLTEVLEEGETLHDATGLYTCSRCGETKQAPLCACEVFTDMPKKSHWAHNAIDWAYFNQLTGGTSATTFSPGKAVSRAEVVTFLHTIKDKPAAEAANPFTDVKQKDYYYNAVLWAVENGITKGTTDTTFSPKQICTRAEIVMFLWAAAGRPEPGNVENKFEDVKAKDYFYSAVLWAVENGVTGGVDETHFGPKVNCSRAQVMLFLKAAYPILTAEETPVEPVDPTDPTEP